MGISMPTFSNKDGWTDWISSSSKIFTAFVKRDSKGEKRKNRSKGIWWKKVECSEKVRVKRKGESVNGSDRSL